MAALAHSTSPLLDPDENSILRCMLGHTLYAQFCAGANASAVSATTARVKQVGFTGVILAYAKESPSDLPVDDHSSEEQIPNPAAETQSIIANEVAPWVESTLETVRSTVSGDFAAFKFTGAGRLARFLLTHRLPPTPFLSQSIDEICQLAHERGVRLLFDGERDMLQHGIDDWTLHFASKYNTAPGRAMIFGTYQAYKKYVPEILSYHLAEAQKNGFTLGVKLVRGAYLSSDPRHLFFNSKADTDACYNKIAASVLRRRWTSTVQGRGEYPKTSLMLATHNASSVRQAYAIFNAGQAKSELLFAQLQGMADEISCGLVKANQSVRSDVATAAPTAMATTSFLPVYKYMAWGTTGECLRYLLRRAQENKDAVERTREDRNAMWNELFAPPEGEVWLTPRVKVGEESHAWGSWP